SYCEDPDLVLELKNLIVICADTLQGYGFPVNRLFDLLFEVRDQYNETLLKKWAVVFRWDSLFLTVTKIVFFSLGEMLETENPYFIEARKPH
ncbi:Exocyst complex component 6, partial [Ataeniobius toweri]|nr:Exocyst complex component 6 [Ataeniobius toweri]